MDYNVVIVGGGSSGLIAARDIASKGLSVCVVEKSPEIGYPVKCSGLFSISGLAQIGVTLDDSLICSTIKGGRFYSPGGEEFLAYSNKDRARVVERKMFDKFLAKEAVRAGAVIKLKTEALGTKIDGSVSLKISTMGDERTLKSEVLIGADGAGSNVARWVGIKREPKFVSAVQAEVAGADVEDDVAEVYFGKEIAPGFYGWILPKSETIEVGVGSQGGTGKTPRTLLKSFLRDNPKVSSKVHSKSILEFNKGAIPVGGPLETVSERVLLVGDAAGQTKASTGGGVITGGICARIAAEAVFNAHENQDFSKSFLQRAYEKRWRKDLEKEFMAHLFLKEILETVTDEEMDTLFELLRKEGVPELMTAFTDTDRPLKFVQEVLKKEGILNWAQRFIDVRKDLLV
jgi:geranylgeranyl reductase family protein